MRAEAGWTDDYGGWAYTTVIASATGDLLPRPTVSRPSSAFWSFQRADPATTCWVELARQHALEPRPVVAETADRELRRRVEALGARAIGPTVLLRQFPPG